MKGPPAKARGPFSLRCLMVLVFETNVLGGAKTKHAGKDGREEKQPKEVAKAMAKDLRHLVGLHQVPDQGDKGEHGRDDGEYHVSGTLYHRDELFEAVRRRKELIQLKVLRLSAAPDPCGPVNT